MSSYEWDAEYDITEEDMHAALGWHAFLLRLEFEDIYKEVDKLLANPDRHPQSPQDFEPTTRTFECKWCGDTNPEYVIRDRRPSKYCDRICYEAQLAYNKRRKEQGLEPI